MITKDISKIGMIVGLVGLVLVGLISRNIAYIIVFLLGCCASQINFMITYKFLDISGTKQGYTRNLTGFLSRMLVYALVLTLAYKWAGTVAMVLAFLGCLVIRVAILIYGVKGGIIDGDNK